MEAKHRTARSLVSRLSSSTTDDSLSTALSEIRLLSKHDPESRSVLADAGAVPLLSRLLLSPDPSASTQENASAALLNISISSPESLMSTPHLLSALAHSLHPSAPPAAAQHAAATLYSLLSVDAYRPIIGSKKILISSLLSLLRSPNSPTRSIKDSLKALFGVALYPLNRSLMVELEVVPALFSLVVKDPRSGIAEDASAVIAQVAGCYESVDAFRKVGGVGVLADFMGDCGGASGRTRENAVAALLNLVMSGGERAFGDLREIEGVESVVREVADKGSSRAKRKAEELLSVMGSGRGRQDCWSSDSDVFSSPVRSSSSLDTASF